MMSFRAFLSWASLLAALSAGAAGLAADWPPTLDPGNTVTRSLDGLVIERHTHGPRAVWGYPAGNTNEWACPPAKETGVPGQNHSSCYLVAPRNPRPGAPLCVVLHSANRTAYDYVAMRHLNRTTVATAVPDDFYALCLSSLNGEWWGSKGRRANPKGPAPAEKRVLDTIEWVVAQRAIDRNRIC